MSSDDNNKKVETELEKAANDTVKLLVNEALRILDAQPKEVKSSMYATFLARFTGEMVFRALKAVPEKSMSRDDLYAFTSNNFASMKQAVQEAISAGFSGAWKVYSGKEVEYYCLVRPVPEAANKEPC